MTVPALSTVHIEEYYDFENNMLGEAKHEFYDGLVIARTGSSSLHSRLVIEASHQFRQCTSNSSCTVYSSDLRVRPRGRPYVFYPDGCIVLGPVQLDESDGHGHTALNPVVIVEVLSPSTVTTDFETKLPAYQTIETLRSILYVHQAKRLVEVWTRMASGEWAWWQYDGGSFEVLGVSGLVLDVDALYARTEVPR